MDNQIQHMHNHSIDYVLAFFGGWIGALTFFFKAHISFNLSDLISTIDYTELFNYSLRSVVGGLIALFIKIIYDLTLSAIKRLFKKGGSNE